MKRALLVAGLFLASGCANLQQFLPPTVTDTAAAPAPSVTFKVADVSQRSLFGATLDLVYAVHNPRSEAVSVSSVRYTLALDGAQAYDGTPAASLTVPAGATAELHVPATIHFAALAKEPGASAHYQGHGTVELQSASGPVSVPFEQAGELELPVQPQLSLEAPHLETIVFPSAVLTLPIRVRNANAYPIAFTGVAGDVSVLGSVVGHASSTEPVTIAPGAEALTQVHIDVPFTGLLTASIEGRVPEVGFDGAISAGSDQLPVTFSARLPLSLQKPELSFALPRIESVSFTSAKLVFPITLKNPNAFALPLGAVTGAIELAGQQIGNVVTRDLGLVGAGQEAKVEVPLEIQLLGAAKSVLSGNPVSVGFKGQLKAASAVLPAVFSEQLKFQR
jgi:LEA14-like dessication related protein